MVAFRKLATMVFCLVMCAGVASAQEQRVALVIGNGTYQNMGTLSNPANDAKAMAATLRRAGFDVIERKNATRREMIEAARAFAQRLSPGGVGLFFYAGHGIQARGANYLLPVDVALSVEDDLKYEAFDVQDIVNKLGDARVRLSIVILDACRDNPFAKSFGSRGFGSIEAPPSGTVIAYATAAGKFAADGDRENGVYTSELLKVMNEPGRELREVFDRAGEAVQRKTVNAQTPWISSSFQGRFYFTEPPPMPRDSVAPSQPAIAREAQEQAAWAAVFNSTTPPPLEAFLERFPDGVYAGIARAKVKEMKDKQPAPAAVVPPPSAPNSTDAKYARDIARDDKIIRRNPKNASAYNERCWARAVLGQLQQALADCEEALRLGPVDAETLDSRGFTYLKLGRLEDAIADYDAALRLDPKQAESLYGRGMAYIAQNNQAFGQRDIAAAKKRDPGITKKFREFNMPGP